MNKKKNNGLKGLLLILVIVCAALAILLIEFSQDNMRILVTSYKNIDKKPLVNARISIDGKTKISDEQGISFFKMRISENDKLILKAEADGFKQIIDTIIIDENRFKSKNISKYIIFEN